MKQFADRYTRNTSPYYTYSSFLLEAADVTSFFWQPLLKAVGRTQLELAGLQARQAQALVHWAHRVMRPASPFDVIGANVELWRTLAEQCADVFPRVADAAGPATHSVAVVQHMLPKRSHDTLILIDRHNDAEEGAFERQVA